MCNEALKRVEPLGVMVGPTKLRRATVEAGAQEYALGDTDYIQRRQSLE